MATPTLNLEALVDIVLKGGEIDDTKFVQAVTNKLKSANVPPMLIDAKYAVDGKPVSKATMLKDIASTRKTIDNTLKQLGEETAGATKQEKAERTAQSQRLAGLRNYLDTLEGYYKEYGKTVSRYSSQTKKDLDDLLTGKIKGADIARDKERLSNLKHLNAELMQQAALLGQVDRNMRKLNQQAVRFQTGTKSIKGEEYPTYSNVAAERLALPGLTRVGQDLTKDSGAVEKALSQEGLAKSMEQIRREQKAGDRQYEARSEKRRQKLKASRDDDISELRGHEKKKTRVSKSAQAIRAQETLRDSRKLRTVLNKSQDLKNLTDPAALTRINKTILRGQREVETGLQSLIATREKYKKQYRDTGRLDVQAYQRLAASIRVVKRELEEYSNLSKSISGRLQEQVEAKQAAAGKGKASEPAVTQAAREIQYGGARLKKAGQIARVAKDDLPYVVKYLEQMQKETRQAAANYLVLEGAASRSFKQAKKSAHEYSNALQKANARLKGHYTLMGQTGALFRQFARYGIGYGAMYQALSGLQQLLSGTVGLENELKNIQAITNATAQDMLSIEASVKRTSITTKFNTTEIAEAARILAQAGVTPEDFPSTLTAVAQFATATGSTIEIASDLLTTMRTVYKELDDSTIANQLTRALNISKLTAEDLKTILSLSAQVSKDYNLTSDQYLSAVSTLRDAGLKASTAATGLRQGLIELFSPDSKTIKVISQRYAQLGESLTSAEVRGKFFSFTQGDNPLVDALRELRRLGFSDRGKATFQRTFDVRAENAIKALIANFEELERSESKITFGNAAAKAAETQMESLANSIKNLGAAISVISYDMASDLLPVIEDVVDGLTDAVNWLGRLDTDLKIQGRTGVGGHLVNALAGGVAGASSVGGGFLPRVAGFAGGSVIGGFSSYQTGQFADDLGLPPEASKTMETLAGLATFVIGLAAFKGIKSLPSLLKRNKGSKVAESLGVTMEGLEVTGVALAASAAQAKNVGKSATTLWGLVKTFGKGIVRLFGPFGLIVGGILTAIDIMGDFNKSSPQARLKAARERQRTSQVRADELVAEVDNYALSKPGKPAADSSTAAKFEGIRDQYRNVLDRMAAKLQVDTANLIDAFEKAVEIDRNAPQEGDPRRGELIGELQQLVGAGVDLTSTGYKEVVKEIINEAGRVQSGVEGFYAAQAEEIDALERSGSLNEFGESMLGSYEIAVDSRNLHREMAGTADIAAGEMLAFFQGWFELMETMARAGTDLNEALDEAKDNASAARDLALSAIDVGGLRSRKGVRSAVEDIIASVRGETPDVRASELGVARQEITNRIAARRAAGPGGLFGNVDRYNSAISNLVYAEERLTEARSKAEELLLRANSEILAEAENVLRNTQEVLARVAQDPYLQAFFDQLEGTPGAALLSTVGAGGSVLPTDLLRRAPTGADSLSPDALALKELIDNFVQRFPVPGELPEDVRLSLDARKAKSLAEVEGKQAESNKQFGAAQQKATRAYNAETFLIEQRISQVKDLLRVRDNKTPQPDLIRELDDLQVSLIRSQGEYNRRMSDLRLKSLQEMEKRLKREIEGLVDSAKRSARTPDFGFVNPLPSGGRVTGGYGEQRRQGHRHGGIDFAAPQGSPVVSSADGQVVFSGQSGAYGNLIKVQHSNGIITKYAHLLDMAVRAGQSVERGQQIGRVGSTGRSTGPHLHFEVERNGTTINPADAFGAGGFENRARLETRYQELLGQLVNTTGEIGRIQGKSPQEIENLTAAVTDRGKTLRELGRLDKEEIKAKKVGLAYLQARLSPDFIGSEDDLMRQVYLRSSGAQSNPEARMAAITTTFEATQDYLSTLMTNQQRLLLELAEDPNNDRIKANITETQELIQQATDELVDLRNAGVAATLDIGTALADAFDISAIAAAMREMAEDDIGSLAEDMHDIIVGAFKDAGEEIADALFNPEAEGDISDRLDRLFQKMFQEVASQIFTAYFNKMVAGAFTRLEGVLGGAGAAGRGGVGGAVAGVVGSVSGAPMQDAVDATAGAVRDAGLRSAEQSEGIFNSLFSGLGSILGSIFNGIKGFIGGIGGGIRGGIGTLAGAFGFARGGMIRGIKGIDKIPGFAMGRAGNVSPIAVTSEESILNRKATSALGEPFINSLNRDPRKLLKGPLSTARISGIGSIDGAAQMGQGNQAATLESLERLQSAIHLSGGAGVTRIEVPSEVLGLSMQTYLERYFEDVIATR